MRDSSELNAVARSVVAYVVDSPEGSRGSRPSAIWSIHAALENRQILPVTRFDASASAKTSSAGGSAWVSIE